MGHELSVALVEVVVTWAVSLVLALALEPRTGADAEVVVGVADCDMVWLAVFVLVVATNVLDAEAVNVVVNVLADMDGVTIVVTTMRLIEVGELCVMVEITVTAEVAAEEATPFESLVSIF